MLPTFVIGLREGLEATLIVVIIATFLSGAGRRDSLRAMWAGVGIAVLFCIGFGVALQELDANLPQRQQEQLETLIFRTPSRARWRAARAARSSAWRSSP